jgi:recombination protein RecA
LQARVNALITRKIYRTIAHRKTTMIFINQLREKIGVMYGNPYTTGGGRALKHMYNTRVEFKLGKPIDTGSGDKKERIGYEINLKCVKNKKGKPYHTAVVDFYFTGNIDNKKSIFFNALRLGVIELSGKTYTFGEKTAVGKDNFLNLLTDKDLEKIEKELWKRAK